MTPLPSDSLSFEKALADLERILRTFTADAIVNDARREFVGPDEIRRWVAHEIVGDRVSMEVTEVVSRGAESVVRARYDGTYDKTGLPRYAQSVSTTGSTLSHDIGSTAYHTTAAIITSSRFEDVVEWYKAQLPSGWNVQVVGNVGALAQQVSIGNILSTLTAATQNKDATPSNALPSKASAGAPPGNALSVAMFSPPANSLGDPSIMIQQSNHTVEITMSRNGSDQ